MGQRANYVVVEESSFSLYYSHWSANTIDRDLFWGPTHALAFIRAQDPTTEWLDEVWCEGGALIDLPRKLLLIFGGEDIKYDVLRHRATLAMTRIVWPGWSVRWAYGGLGDLIDHLCLPRNLVRSGRAAEPPITTIRRGKRALLSFTTGGIHRVAMAAHDLFDCCPSSLEPVRSWDDPPELRVAANDGIHVDLERRHVQLWEASYRQDLRPWDGWTVEHHGDAFERHIEVTQGRLRLVKRSQAEVVDEIVRDFVHRPGFNPAELLERIRAERPGHELRLNPHFLSYHPDQLPDEERARILMLATSGLGSLWAEG